MAFGFRYPIFIVIVKFCYYYLTYAANMSKEVINSHAHEMIIKGYSYFVKKKEDL